MPKYRALHTKIIDSFDFNEMPSDFHHVTWMLLPLIADSAGRGIYNAAWLRAKLYPMREDVSTGQIMDAFIWFVERGMISVYTVDGKQYFYIPSFSQYQSHLEREAKSILPDPPEENKTAAAEEEDVTYSGVTPELVRSNSRAYESASASVNESVLIDTPKIKVSPSPKPNIMQIIARASGLSAIPPREIQRLEQIYSLIDAHGPDAAEQALRDECARWRVTKGKTGQFYRVTNMGWVDWAQEALDHRNGNGGGNGKMSLAQWRDMSTAEQDEWIIAGREIPTR